MLTLLISWMLSSKIGIIKEISKLIDDYSFNPYCILEFDDILNFVLRKCDYIVSESSLMLESSKTFERGMKYRLVLIFFTASVVTGGQLTQ